MDKVQENVVKIVNHDEDHLRQCIIIVVMIIRDRVDKQGAAGKCSEEATTGGKNRWKGNDEDASRQLPPVFLWTSELVCDDDGDEDKDESWWWWRWWKVLKLLLLPTNLSREKPLFANCLFTGFVSGHNHQATFLFELKFSTPPASKSPVPNIDLEAQEDQKVQT